MVEHVKARAWFTASHAELAWEGLVRDSQAPETDQQTVETSSTESTVPDSVKVAARKVDDEGEGKS